MNERNKENKEATRTGSMTRAERINQGSWETADKNWIPSEGKLSVRQLAHVDRRGVKKVKGAEPTRASTDIVRGSRMNLAERVLNEFNRSERHGLENGSLTTDDIKAARVTRGGNRARVNTTADQRYAGRGVKKVKGVKMHSVTPAGHERIGRAGAKIAVRTQDEKDARRRTYLDRQQASTEIIKNGRMALAEMVLEAVKRKDTAVQDLKPEDLNKLETGLKKAKPGRVAKATKIPPAPKKGKTKNKKSDVLMRAGSSSSNHPDYLKKKLYNRATKDGGYGKEGKPTAADTEVNQQGVQGHEDEIAKNKKKSDRQEKSQRVFDKIRTMRGLVPLMPGEKHSSNDKIGNTEN